MSENINNRFASLKVVDITATAAEINQVCDGNLADAAELSNLKGVDLAKTPTACGLKLQTADGKQYISAYNGTGGALTAGKVYVLAYDNAAGQEVQIAAPATSAFPVMTCVAVAATANGAIGWFQVGGLCESHVEGTTDVAAGDFLEVLNGENDWKKDGAARTTVSGAVAVDAQAADSAVKVTVMLINEQHTIAAS